MGAPHENNDELHTKIGLHMVTIWRHYVTEVGDHEQIVTQITVVNSSSNVFGRKRKQNYMFTINNNFFFHMTVIIFFQFLVV